MPKVSTTVSKELSFQQRNIAGSHDLQDVDEVELSIANDQYVLTKQHLGYVFSFWTVGS